MVLEAFCLIQVFELQDASGNALSQQQVSGNASQGGLNNQGYLTSLKVDGNWYQLPELSSGVAEALPGLSETLAGPPTCYNYR